MLDEANIHQIPESSRAVERAPTLAAELIYLIRNDFAEPTQLLPCQIL
jgi:hypothetical protein